MLVEITMGVGVEQSVLLETLCRPVQQSQQIFYLAQVPADVLCESNKGSGAIIVQSEHQFS